MPRQRVLDFHDKAARAGQRQVAGQLRDNRVAKATFNRYQRAVALFVQWVQAMGWEPAPDYETLDSHLCSYLECLWHEGENKGLANDTLSGSQHFLITRRRFAGAWSLLTTWGKLEVPCRAPPLPLFAVLGLAGYGIAHGREDFAAVILTAYHCILRTGEMLSLAPQFLALDSSYRGAIALPWTKIGQQRGAQESVTVDESLAGFWLVRICRQRAAEAPLFAGSSHCFRALFNKALLDTGLNGHGFMPYSLRRGGATHDFLSHQSMQRTLHRGRWGDARTGKIYITDGAAQIVALRISPACIARLQAYQGYLFPAA
jgi:hypothetical protein